MCDCFHNNYSTYPPVEKIECIETYAKNRNEWIVPPHQKEKPHHVNSSQVSSPSTNVSNQSGVTFIPIVQQKTINQIAQQVKAQEYSMKSRRQRPNVDSLGHLHLAVVALLMKRCVY